MLDQFSPLAQSNDYFEVEYRESEHGFFPELIRLIISLSSVGIGFELHNSGTVNPYARNQPMVIEGKQSISGLEIHCFPYALFQHFLVSDAGLPKTMKILKKPISP